MPRHCSAGGCKSRDNRETRKAGITFHKLPKGATRRNLWITNSHRTGCWDPQTDFVYFCSKHFTPESFELTGYSGIRRLREDAFPTVFDASLESKRKGPGRPRKHDAIHVRKKPQSQAAVQEEQKKAENSTPVNGEKPDLAEEAPVSTPARSEPENPSPKDARPPSPPVRQQPATPERPTSPSRYMRRLPPPPGFYLPKEHSYAQLCPLLWRRRYERAVDCLEKALRQLNAARRRENRLRNALSRLREKRPRPAPHSPQDNGQKSKRGWVSSGRSRPGGEGSCLVRQGELDVEPEESGLCESVTGEQADWTRYFGQNMWPEEEPGGYCSNCNRACEGHSCRVARAVPRTAKNGHRSAVSRSREDGGKWTQLAKQSGSRKDMCTDSEADAQRESSENLFCSADVVESTEDVQLVVLEGHLGEGFETSLNLHNALKLPTSESLPQTQAQVGLQHVILNGESLHHSTHVHYLPATSDFPTATGPTKGAQYPEDACQQVFFMQETTEGLFLVPVTPHDRLTGGNRTDDGAENVQTVIGPEVTFHQDSVPMTEDEQGCGSQLPDVSSTSRIVREDVREKLKEHLEGFQLQLSNEYIT